MFNLLKSALKMDAKKTEKIVDGRKVTVKEWPLQATSDPKNWGRSGYTSQYN